jgi:hypothetical protein
MFRRQKSPEAMTKRKIIFLIGSLVVVVSFVVGRSIVLARDKARAKTCGSQMISIGLAARLWAGDNNDYCPSNLALLSSEIGTLKVLLWPSDRSRSSIASWESLASDNSSYEIVTKGLRVDEPNKIFLRCKIHGFVGYANGRAFDGKREIRKY